MALLRTSHDVAILIEPGEEFIICFLFLGRRWDIGKIYADISCGTHMDPMHDDRIQVSNHAIGKVAIFAESIPQRSKSCAPSYPYQRVEVQHATPIGLDNSKMIRNIAKNAGLFRRGSKKTFQDCFTDMVKEFGDRHWIGRCNSVSYSSVCGRKDIPRIFYAS